MCAIAEAAGVSGVPGLCVAHISFCKANGGWGPPDTLYPTLATQIGYGIQMASIHGSPSKTDAQSLPPSPRTDRTPAQAHGASAVGERDIGAVSHVRE